MVPRSCTGAKRHQTLPVVTKLGTAGHAWPCPPLLPLFGAAFQRRLLLPSSPRGGAGSGAMPGWPAAPGFTPLPSHGVSLGQGRQFLWRRVLAITLQPLARFLPSACWGNSKDQFLLPDSISPHRPSRLLVSLAVKGSGGGGLSQTGAASPVLPLCPCPPLELLGSLEETPIPAGPPSAP